MIQSTFPLDQNEMTVCENGETNPEATAAFSSSSDSSFRELLREKPKKNVCEDLDEDEEPGSADLRQPSPPSPFSLIQHEAKETAQKNDARSDCGTCETPGKRTRVSPQSAFEQTTLEPTAKLKKAIETETSDAKSSEKSVQAAAQVPVPSMSQVSATPSVRSSIPAANGLPATMPWQGILESASQGITHVLKKDVKETTLTLDGPLFANTPLAGVKMTVREYSTAPLAYNIHFACAPHAMHYLQPHLKTLATLFQSRRSPFSIHSVDADLGDGIPSPIEKETGDDQQHEEERG